MCNTKKNAITTNLSDILQGTHLEWTNASHGIDMCKTLITQFKSDESLSSMMDEAKYISEKCFISLNITSPVYSIRSYINIGEIDVNRFTKEFATKVSEKITAEMLLRFPPDNMNILTGIDALNPKSANFLNEKLLCKLMDH